MPVFLLAALFLAFGFDTASQFDPLPREEVGWRVGQTVALLLLIAALSFVWGRGVAFRARQAGAPTSRVRRLFNRGVRLVEVLNLVAFGWIIHGIGWPRVVRSGFGLDGLILVDDVLILLPFLLAQLAGWWGLYAGERALRANTEAGRRMNIGRHLILKARQSLGLVLPVLLVFALGQDLIRRQWPEMDEDPWAMPIGMGLMGLLVLVLSPLFVRLAWPTHPLPPGPLRDRLERVARRFGFRCTDILIWDTGRAIVNAGVTGSLPWFRYVLLTDALVENLDPHQVAAVFGHEIGHIAHRHLNYFGFFFLGSLGVMALVGGAIDDSVLAVVTRLGRLNNPTVLMIARTTAELIALGLYFLIAFGYVSRRFERQADVFGCRVVSCGRIDCPPHADLNGQTVVTHLPVAVCPVGIRIFAEALANVATLNGLEQGARSWRHGSIARRIAFLEALEGKPEAERRFQAGVSRLRLGVALILIAAVLLAIATGSIEHLR
jgi:STE24 endopeptidase